MNPLVDLYRSLEAIAAASGDGTVDWSAVAEAAKAATEPGPLALRPGEQEGFASDVRDARAAVRAASGLSFDVPQTVEVHNRHHWIDANVPTFEAVMAPLEERQVAFPGILRRANTATMATLLSFLADHVLGQYDPVLLAEGDHALYFVRPNIVRVAEELAVEDDRFRRWIAFHEVTHAAEFSAAPWLSDYLEDRLEGVIEVLAAGRLDREAFRDLDIAMTAVEGYAEFVLDRAFDQGATELRRKVDARRQNRGPIADFLGRLFGLGLKRRQYERGKAFFDEIARLADDGAAGTVWASADHLPTCSELDNPDRWLRRTGG